MPNMLPNILQSEQELNKFGIPFLPKISKLGGPYLPHHWSDWPNILDLVLWVPKQHVYQVSLKSETVGFNSLGDLTQNDPAASQHGGNSLAEGSP